MCCKFAVKHICKQYNVLHLLDQYYIKICIKTCSCSMPQQKIIKKSASISEKVSNANVVEASINSPLQRFVRAKKKINQTFEEILSFLKDSRKFLSGSDISDHCDNETRKDLKQVKIYHCLEFVGLKQQID